jgi:hypothetical protein
MKKLRTPKACKVFVYNYSGSTPICVDVVEWSGNPNNFDVDKKTIRQWHKYACEQLGIDTSEITLYSFVVDLEFFIQLDGETIRKRLLKMIKRSRRKQWRVKPPTRKRTRSTPFIALTNH